MEHFSVSELLQARSGQPGFHVASERHLRIEFRNLRAGEGVEPFQFAGDLVVTCFRGSFVLRDGHDSLIAKELDQVIVPENSRLELECVEDGTVEMIWAPAFAPIRQG